MIYEVDKSIFSTLQDNLPFLRFEDANYVFLEESYLSTDGRVENPWIEPEEVTIVRRTSMMEVSKDWDHPEKGIVENFEILCEKFFDDSIPKTLNNVKNFIMGGTRDTLDVMEISNLPMMLSIFKKARLSSYLEPSRYVVRVPCGEYNLDLVKFPKVDKLYIEITKLYQTTSNRGAESLCRILNLGSEIKSDWANIYQSLIRSGAVKS